MIGLINMSSNTSNKKKVGEFSLIGNLKFIEFDFRYNILKVKSKKGTEKPEEVKPETKPADAKPEEVKPETKPADAKPEEVKPETKPADAKPEEVKPETKPADAKPEEVKPKTEDKKNDDEKKKIVSKPKEPLFGNIKRDQFFLNISPNDYD